MSLGQDILDRVLTQRTRRAYRGKDVPESSLAGYAGLVAEMQWGLAQLSDEQREQADARVFDALFGGKVGAALVRRLWRRSQDTMARLFATLSPKALHFLVGEIKVTAPTTNFVPRCAFREHGGKDLCLRVCRLPTEAYTAANLVPVRFSPAPDSLACTWHWGEAAHVQE